MIISKFKPYGIFAISFSLFLCVFICLFIYILISVIFLGGHIIKRGTLSPYGAIFFILVLFSMLVFIVSSFIRYAFITRIYKEAKEISFTNIFTRQTITYNFADFESYLDFEVVSKGDVYKVIYLIKEGHVEKRITGFYYSNIDELQAALSPIKYLGFQKNSKEVKKVLNQMYTNRKN